MPARRCNDCKDNWPQSFEFNKCPRCERQTIYHSSYESDYTRDEALAIQNGDEPLVEHPFDTSPAHVNRLERYLEMEFSYEDATKLADAKRAHRDSKGKLWQPPLNHLDVAAALAAGCTHALAMEVFS